ncbi:hypothetical protein LB505_009947 [Fusarium chuoi]|nr:hypothetical protein LB505_009947 [Fusarium chuoi]
MKGKIQQQLKMAHSSGVTQIWIFNVGDIKPLELPSTLALALAWNIDSVQETTVQDFFRAYVAREFGSQLARDSSELLLGHDRLMALRRHEHIEPGTFSIINYRESEGIMARYFDLESRANALFDAVPISHKAAVFQLVVHPIKASRIYTELCITQAKNNLYGQQRRNTTNVLAQRALSLFEDDWKLSQEYHDNPWSGTKWNHIVKQPHYGFSWDTWRAPSRDMITGLSFVQRWQNSNRINGQMGVAVEGHTGVRPGRINEENDRMQPSRGDLVPGLTLPPLNPYGVQTRFFELYSRGTRRMMWVASPEVDWVSVSPSSGYLVPDAEEDQRVEIRVDWDLAPRDFEGTLLIDIRSLDGEHEQVHLPVSVCWVPASFSGWVESDGCVVLEPAAMELTNKQWRQYQLYPHLGRTSAGSIGLAPNAGADPEWLEWNVFFFSSCETVTVHLYFTMTLETNPASQKSYDISLNDSIQESVPLLEAVGRGELPVGWSRAVQDGVWVRKHVLKRESGQACQLRYRPLIQDILLEKVVVDLGGLRESYLGPPASTFT